MHLSKILKKIVTFFLIISFFFILSFVINKIPNGFIIAHGDFCQGINPIENYKDLFYTIWDNGTFSATFTPFISFYALEALLYNLGFSYSNIANTIFFLFSIFSFISFYFSIKIINKDIPFFPQITLSIIYALNIFTFSIFSSSVGYTSFFFIYIFIPIVFAYFEETLKFGKLKDYFLFSILFFICTVSFSNIVFLVALLFLQFILFFTFLISKKVRFNINTFKKLIIFIFIELTLSSYFLLPWFLYYRTYASQLTSNTALGYVFDLMKNYQRGILYNISLSMDSWNYPFNNIYGSNLFIGISLGYFIFIFLFLFTQKKNDSKPWKNYLIFLIFLFILAMRFAPPFTKINEIIYYNIPIFKLFRGADKLFVFLPFFCIVLIGLLINNSRISHKVINLLLVFLVVIPFAFYVGGIPKYLTAKNTQRSAAPFAIKIPDEYFKIKKIIDADKTQQSILSIPDTGSGNYYKKWDYEGVGLNFYKKNMIYSLASDNSLFGNKSSFQEYDSTEKVDLSEFIYLLQKFSNRFILLHKDFDNSISESSKNSIDAINQLESKKILKKIEENEYFELYELDKSYQAPIISSKDNKIYFQKINPVKYKIFIPDLNGKINLEFNRVFSGWWKIYVEPTANGIVGNEVEYYKTTDTHEYNYNEKIFEFSDLKYLFSKSVFDNNHIMVKDYANSWEVNSEYIQQNYSKKFYKINQDGSIGVELTIYFKVQSFYHYCLLIILISFFSFSGFMIYKKVKTKKIRKNDI